MLIDKRKNTGLKHFTNLKTFIEYSNDINYVYKNSEEHNQDKKPKQMIIFDDMIANIFGNRKLNPIVTEIYIRSIKPKHFSSFYYTTLFCCTKKY